MTALRTLPDLHCECCGKVFRQKREGQRFCSKACWYSKASNAEKVCGVCGTEFKGRTAQQIYCSVGCKNKAITKDKRCVCAVCKKEFDRPHGKTRAYCSISCANTARASGMKKPEMTLDARVVGDTTTSSSGYLMVRVDGKKVMQHRLVMESVLGRKLLSSERVHHKNGDRKDKRPENLELWTGVDSSKKDPHGIRVVDKVIDMLDRLTVAERVMVAEKLKSLSHD